MSLRWRVAEHDYDKHDSYVLRSKGYRRYYRNIPEGIYMDELDVSLLPDGSPRARTILVSEDDTPVGTGRASLIHSPRFPMMQSEIEFLFNVPYGLLQCVQDETGLNAETVSVGELSRLTVLHETQSDEIIRQVFEGFVAVAQHIGIDVYMGITKDWIAERLRKVGVDFVRIPNTYLERDNPVALWYCVKHFDYFYPELPNVLPQVVRTNFTETTTMSYCEIREIIDYLYPADEVFLHWLTPESIIQKALHPAYAAAK